MGSRKACANSGQRPSSCFRATQPIQVYPKPAAKTGKDSLHCSGFKIRAASFRGEKQNGSNGKGCTRSLFRSPFVCHFQEKNTSSLLPKVASIPHGRTLMAAISWPSGPQIVRRRQSPQVARAQQPLPARVGRAQRDAGLLLRKGQEVTKLGQHSIQNLRCFIFSVLII